MAKKNAEELKAWLLKLHKDIGRPIVVSLLVEDNKVEMISLAKKKYYFDEHNEDEC